MKIIAPCRVSRTYTQKLVAGPAAVFPLLCPVREADWIEGWDPLVVITGSGVAEPDCVFVTPGNPKDAIWYITRHEPESGSIQMLKITPDVTACRLDIKVSPARGGAEATISYTHTSLGPEGDEFVQSFTAEYYQLFMQEWEARINRYLAQARGQEPDPAVR